MNYFGLAALVVLLISYGCKKETNEISLVETNQNNSATDSSSSLSVLGKGLYDFAGGERKYAVSFSIGTKMLHGIWL